MARSPKVLFLLYSVPGLVRIAWYSRIPILFPWNSQAPQLKSPLVGIPTCPILYVSSSQVAGILPSNAPLGDAFLTVEYKRVSSRPRQFGITSSAFGIYTAAGSGLGPGIFTGVDFKPKSFDQPAQPGETLIAWGTGLGAISDGD